VYTPRPSGLTEIPSSDVNAPVAAETSVQPATAPLAMQESNVTVPVAPSRFSVESPPSSAVTYTLAPSGLIARFSSDATRCSGSAACNP